MLSTQTHAWYDYRESILAAVIEWSGTEDGSWLFNGCSKMTEVDLSGFDTSVTTNISGMFYNCSGLKKLDMSGFYLPALKNADNVFAGCYGLEEIKTPRSINVYITIDLPNIPGGKWRKADGTVISTLPRNATITSNMIAITFQKEYSSRSDLVVKDAAGKEISVLLVPKGSRETQVVTIEMARNTDVVSSVTIKSADATVSIREGHKDNQYLISPTDMEQGFTSDEKFSVNVSGIDTYKVKFQYNNTKAIKDVIVVNGGQRVTGKPDAVQISNAYYTSVYVKVDDESLDVPEIKWIDDDVAFITDTGVMNEKEKNYMSRDIISST